MSSAAPPTPDRLHGTKPTSRLRFLLGVVAFIGLGLSLWIYALVFYEQDRKVDELADRTFPEAAEPICAAAVAEVNDLPRAHQTRDHIERADVVDRATTRLERMVRELRTVVPDTADAPGINTWLDHWDIWLDDRRDYSERLRSDETARFYVQEVGGTHVTKGVDHFAEVNRMDSCSTTGDVA